MKLTREEKYLCDILSDVAPTTKSEAIRLFRSYLASTEAFSLAKSNQVASLVAHVLFDSFGESKVSPHWQEAHRETYQRISSYLSELDRIAVILAKEGIPLVALKNSGIARGMYPCPGCCPMGDIDVLVERCHFYQAHQILVNEGYELSFKPPYKEANFNVSEANGVAEYSKLLSSGESLWFEMHWRPVTGRWIRPDQEPSAEELLSRSTPIPGTAARLLAPEDNLLQVALHTAKHSYVRAPGFRLHTDVDRIVRRQPIDWEVFLARVQALQVKTPVYFSLVIPKELFGTPIPEAVLKTLRPARWKYALITSMINRAGLFNPDERKFGKLSYILFSALLYDDLTGLIRAIFPGKLWMRERYSVKNNFMLPIIYLQRLVDLTFRRAI